MGIRKKITNGLSYLAVLSVVMLVINACYPGGADFVDQLDVVSTNYDDEFDFTPEITYSLPDCVVEIDDEDFDNPGNEIPDCISQQFSDEILKKIRENMTSYGFQEVDVEDDPDLIFLVSAMETTNLYYFYNPGWWWGYYPGWGPGWGWYYPYPPSYVTSYTTGTVLMQISDPDGIEDERVPIHWNGIINGLLQGSNSSILSRIDRNVDQAFAQSPYLQK